MTRTWAPSPRCLGSRAVVASLLLLASLPFGATPSLARPRNVNTETAHGRLQTMQPVSFRLLGMGSLDLAIRDPLNQTNLWQFGGLSAGLGLDRDSTSVELWGAGGATTTDVDRGGTEEEIRKDSGTDFSLEGVLRFSETLALGADAGFLSTRRALPYDNVSNSSVSQFVPAAHIAGSGRLVGPILWGLNAPFAGATYSRDWWANQFDGSRVVIGDKSHQLAAPNVFFPDDGQIDLGGIGGSLAYQHATRGEAGFYLLHTTNDVHFDQEGQRQLYDTEEKRQISDYGVALVGRPGAAAEVGLTAGRSSFSSVEEYRFSVSGGSTGAPLQGRGDRLLRNHRAEFVEVRYQGEGLVPGLTLGADGRIAYERWHEGPGTGDGNFNEFVLTRLTSDTLQAPPLVMETVSESRDLGFGLGASYGFTGQPVRVGGEYHWGRDAQSGTNLDRRPQGWSVRFGGEWIAHPRWTVRAGWVHDVGDEDRLTALNEGVADRITAGGGWQAGSGWVAQLYGQASWGRTDFADPLGTLEKGWSLGLQVGREF